jgi:hypothetical protein
LGSEEGNSRKVDSRVRARVCLGEDLYERACVSEGKEGGVQAHNDIQVPVLLRANVPYPPFILTRVTRFSIYLKDISDHQTRPEKCL